jgi:serine/threonine protein kinase
MGTVYRAVRVDDACRKTVALKLVRGGSRSDSFERRFRQEREILARLLVDAHGVSELLDFGFAKLLASGVEPDRMPTATVLPLMTPEHASPEQVKGQPVTTAGDVYSLGSFSTSGEMMVGASG